MNQRESVYSAVVAVKGNVSGKVELTTEERARVVGLVCEAFDAGEVTFKETDANQAKLADAKELKKYVVGLVNNWLRKDPNLNGGEKYEAKNPGTRSSDAQLKNLNLLLKATTDEKKQQKGLPEVRISSQLSTVEKVGDYCSPKVDTTNGLAIFRRMGSDGTLKMGQTPLSPAKP